ncbi:hypothetical protein KC865_03435 [Candidatus Kaiserbacteria bacterium]|nr:hypothetical protein [Candidatus Kaiserbacteria bacterium]USN92510.1 MAG: hypothetical protein H6782_01695 [Candidatus Nomurabacteria bacterium]
MYQIKLIITDENGLQIQKETSLDDLGRNWMLLTGDSIGSVLGHLFRKIRFKETIGSATGWSS